MSIDAFFNHPNRTMCEVLEEMRAMQRVHNYSGLLGLIEEVQSMGNRMEAALADKADVESWLVLRSKLGKEIEKLQKKKRKLGK